MAEWVVDITTKADRSGLASQFGDLYDNSELKGGNDKALGEETLQSKAALQRTKSVRCGTPLHR